MENYTIKQKISNVLRRYGYYILLGVLLLSIVLTLIIVTATVKPEEEPVSVPTNTSITPYMPVLNASIYKGYFGDELAYNTTLKQWETHNGIDFQVANGSSVYSILDGKVSNIYTNVLEGTVVVIDHENGIQSTYGSLDEELKVSIGDSVSRGDTIGVVATSATAESDAGAHLHFSMKDNGKKVDPASYLNIETK